MNGFELTVSYRKREMWWCDAWVDGGFCWVWKEVGRRWGNSKLFTVYTPDADGGVGIAMFKCKCERLPKLYCVNADAMLNLEWSSDANGDVLSIGESDVYRRKLWTMLIMYPKDKGNLVELCNLVARMFVRVIFTLREWHNYEEDYFSESVAMQIKFLYMCWAVLSVLVELIV